MNIAFRLDRGPSIGSGHLIRCTALAQELASRKQNVILICRDRTAALAFPTIYLKDAYRADQADGYAFPPIDDEIGEMVQVIKRYQIDCLIVDHYGATTNYFSRLKPHVKVMAAIDDMAKISLPVDMVINGNAYADERGYKDAAVKLCGTSYTLLRDCFRNIPPKKISDDVREIYITSGGADPLGLCEKTLSFLSFPIAAQTQIHVIIGPDFSEGYQKRLKKTAGRNGNVHMIYHADMRKCMERADLFISAAGSTLYELAACGVPDICIVLSEDQIRLAKSLHDLGAACCIGDIMQVRRLDLLEAVDNFKDPAVRMTVRDAQRKLVDGYGSVRAADAILNQLSAL